jgi:nondiscriminating aspartyl-tRNA synthetase
MRTLVKDVSAKSGGEVTVKGWVHRIRDMGGISFVVLRDRSGMVQLVYGAGQQIDFHLECVIEATGRAVANEKSPGGVEIEVGATSVLSRSDPDLPFPVNRDPGESNIEQILDNRILSLRNPKIRTIFELQSDMFRIINAWMHSQGFREIKTCKIVGSGTEGGTNLFAVDYFGRKVYLAQSPQLYKQAMISAGLERVFETSHAYRAEKHDTARHLNEYVSFDVEMAFIESELDLIQFEKELLAHLFEKLAVDDAEVLKLWGASVPSPEAMLAAPILSCDEVKKITAAMAGHPMYDVTPETERLICEWAEKERGVPACFINDWPRRSRAFYTHPKGNRSTMSFDLIFRGLEITSGGRRIEDYKLLVDSLPRFGLTEEGLGDYPKIFKYGCPPHGGFAIGIERLTQKILGLANVKEASPFPRDRRRVTP